MGTVCVTAAPYSIVCLNADDQEKDTHTHIHTHRVSVRHTLVVMGQLFRAWPEAAMSLSFLSGGGVLEEPLRQPGFLCHLGTTSACLHPCLFVQMIIIITHQSF